MSTKLAAYLGYGIEKTSVSPDWVRRSVMGANVSPTRLAKFNFRRLVDRERLYDASVGIGADGKPLPNPLTPAQSANVSRLEQLHLAGRNAAEDYLDRYQQIAPLNQQIAAKQKQISELEKALESTKHQLPGPPKPGILGRLTGFLRGRAKTSAHVDELLEGLRRTKPMRLSKPITLEGVGLTLGEGPAYAASKKDMRRSVLPAMRKDPEMSKSIDDAIESVPAGVEGRIIMSPGGGLKALQAAQRRAPQMNEKFIQDMEQINPALGPTLRKQMAAANTPIKPSGPGAKAINAVVGAHEMAERRVPPHLAAMTPGGHRNMGVLALEHNITRRLTGPGADEARQGLHQMRDLTAENDQFDAYLRQVFGERAVQEYGTGSSQKIPPAMLERIERQYRADANAAMEGLFGR